MTPHERVVKQAQKTNNKLYALFGKLGTTEHPRGKVLVAYRQAWRALQGNLNDPAVVAETLAILQQSVTEAGQEIFGEAVGIGSEQAEVEIASYGLPQSVSTIDYQAALVAWIGVLAQQIGSIRALALSGRTDEGMILGDGLRIGLFTPAPVVREGAKWITTLSQLSYDDVVNRSVSGQKDEFLKQAIAAIDERTTDCCLQVHGQTVKMDKPFKLTGTPRFADELDGPPFHWYCRTGTVLVPVKEKDDDLSQQLRQAAKNELEARAEIQEKIDTVKGKLAKLTGQPDIRKRKEDSKQAQELRDELRALKSELRQEIHPASGLSGR